MLKHINRNQLLIALALAMLMAATRIQHIGALGHLRDASWAVFFLAGLYLRSTFALPALLVEAALIDYVAITYGGVNSFCVSAAYLALLPAYGSLWFAGRWYAKRWALRADTLVPFAGSLLISGMSCELISSGSFYLFSGRFAEPTLSGFIARLAQYMPSDLASLTLYAGLAAVTHLVLMRTSAQYARIGDFR